MNLFKAITYHPDYDIPAESINVKLGALNEAIINEVMSYFADVSIDSAVDIKDNGYYFFVYVKGSRIDCEYI